MSDTPMIEVSSTKSAGAVLHRLDALPDATDFRDLMYSATLVEVPPRIALEDYRSQRVPVLDQGREGACTGFGLATVANFLMRTRQVDPDNDDVSPLMLYVMAKRYDEWPGEAYAGSTARGAMKGWYKHGVCAEKSWPYRVNSRDRTLNDTRAVDALNRTLGAYYRVNHKDIVAMHSALVEVGILYATARVHEGWKKPNGGSTIVPSPVAIGGHAFAIVAYDELGFWIQNSWGTEWGNGGYARITYGDWLENGMDVWVARLGVPIRVSPFQSTGIDVSEERRHTPALTNIDAQPHIIRVGNDGKLCSTGSVATEGEDVKRILDRDFCLQAGRWRKKRLLLYAHGGLVPEKNAIEQAARFRRRLLPEEIYPILFVWRTDYWTSLKNILADALSRRRPDGIAESQMEFVRDRLDDALEPLVRTLTGKAQWDEMKENGILATKNDKGAGRVFLRHLDALLRDQPDVEIHIAAHSAGSIFLAPLVQLLTTVGRVKEGPMVNKTSYGHAVKSCTLWAPAITLDLFKQTYLPAIESDQIERFALYTLTDRAELDDNCANIYAKSLLYLVSNALEEHPAIPLLRPDGKPLLGMQKFVDEDADMQRVFSSDRAERILAPNSDLRPGMASSCHSHGDFDNDEDTLMSTLARINVLGAA